MKFNNERHQPIKRLICLSGFHNTWKRGRSPSCFITFLVEKRCYSGVTSRMKINPSVFGSDFRIEALEIII